MKLGGLGTKQIKTAAFLAFLALSGATAAENKPAASGADATPPAPSPAVPTDPLAKAAFDVLDKNCARCHQIGEKMTKRKVPPKGFGNILALDEIKSDAHLVIPGNPDGSLIFQQIAKQLMPYDVYQEADLDQPSPSQSDIKALRDWIASLSASADADCAKRKMIDVSAMVVSMASDLKDALPSRVKGTRYLTLTHLYNACASDDEIAIYRAGAVKLLNSLSHNSTLVKLETIDAEKTILRFNIDDLGWSTSDWDKLVAADPYAVAPDTTLFSFLTAQTATALPFVRADWFGNVASRPPLYNALLRLPNTFGELQKQIGVDVAADIKALRVKRAGFQNSGVSKNNRLVERHDIQTGYFWTSYDFSGNRGNQSLFDFPLGPGGGEFGFVHNGGESIFSLPNGMQGYYLNNAKGEKLDAGPVEIVFDRNHPEDPRVINGISCMGCHDAGIKKARDEIRERDFADRRFPREARDRIDAMFPKAEEMDDILAQDLQRFASALTRSGVSPNLREKKSGSEPVTALSDFYDGPVDLKLAAAEYGLTKEQFVTAANGNPDTVALARRLDQGNIPRDQFETDFPKMVAVLTDSKPIGKNGKVEAFPVAPPSAQKVEPAHSFDLALYSDKSSYSTKEHPVITVTSKSDCFLTLIDIDSHDKATVLFPNKFQQDNHINASKEFKFPDPIAPPFQYSFTEPGVETVSAVCTQDKRDVDGIAHDFSKAILTSAPSYTETLTRSIVVGAPKSPPKPGASEARAAIKIVVK